MHVCILMFTMYFSKIIIFEDVFIPLYEYLFICTKTVTFSSTHLISSSSSSVIIMSPFSVKTDEIKSSHNATKITLLAILLG